MNIFAFNTISSALLMFLSIGLMFDNSVICDDIKNAQIWYAAYRLNKGGSI